MTHSARILRRLAMLCFLATGCGGTRDPATPPEPKGGTADPPPSRDQPGAGAVEPAGSPSGSAAPASSAPMGGPPVPPPRHWMPYKVGTDEEVLIALRDLEKKEVTRQSTCIARPARFPDVVVTGWRVDNQGCELGYVFVEGVGHKEFKEASDHMMDLHYAKAGETGERQRLVRDWTMDVFLAFRSVLRADDPPKDFSNQNPFHPPRVENTQHTYVVRVWMRDPVGMRPAPPSFRAVKLTFQKTNGALIDRE